MPKPTLTTPPTAPTTTDPATFAEREDAHIAWRSTNVAEETDMIDWIDEQATAAESNATIAIAQAEIATTKAEEAAAAAAAAISSPGVSATSTTELTVGTGSKSLTIETGKTIVVGMTVKIAYTTSATTWMYGDVTAYDDGTGSLTVYVTLTNGSGTQSAWTISLSAPSLVTLDTNTFIGQQIMPSIRLTTGATNDAYLVSDGSGNISPEAPNTFLEKIHAIALSF